MSLPYRGIRREPCACGGEVRGDARAWASAVRAHAATAAHRDGLARVREDH